MLAVMSFVWAFPSCMEQGESLPPMDDRVVENTFTVGDVTYPVRSAVFTDDEIPGYTTIYLSPTKGISSFRDMLRADDYLKITTETTYGNVDLSISGNKVTFGKYFLDKSNIARFGTSNMALKVFGSKVVDIILDTESSSETALKVDYYGVCRKLPYDPMSDVDVMGMELIQAVYFGDGEMPYPGVKNYNYMISTAPYELVDNGQGGNSIMLTEPGYIFFFDTYAKVNENTDLLTAQPGTFEPGLYMEGGTYLPKYSGGVWQDGTGKNGKAISLKDNVVITKTSEEAERYLIESSFIDENGVTRTFAYEGNIYLADGSQGGGALPRLLHDAHVEGATASAVYNGNLFDNGAGMMIINIYDEKYTSDQYEGQGGLAASLVVFNKLFSNPKDATLIEGTYEIGTTFEQGTAMMGLEMNYMGMLVPFGSYVICDDGSTYGQFAFARSGSVTISKAESGDGFDIEFEFTSEEGFTFTGEYSGEIEISDESVEDDSDDGTSTLEEDHDMVLTPIDVARLASHGDVRGMAFDQYHNQLDVRLGIQKINIGSVGGWDMDKVLENGDVFGIGLIVEPGMQDVIVPGTYGIFPEWTPVKASYVAAPSTYYHGLCGYFQNDAEYWKGTYWNHFEPGRENLYIDGFALIYGGSVTIRKPDGTAPDDGIFAIDIDGTCTKGLHVRANWQGKIINMGTGEPVRVGVASGRTPIDDALGIENKSADPAQMSRKAVEAVRSGKQDVSAIINRLPKMELK